MQVTFLYFEDCPSHAEALARLRRVMAEEGVAAEIEIVRVETDEAARRWQFPGSPTIRINGQDIDPVPTDAYFGLSCRAYHLEDGRISPLPSVDMIRRAVKQAKTYPQGPFGKT